MITSIIILLVFCLVLSVEICLTFFLIRRLLRRRDDLWAWVFVFLFLLAVAAGLFVVADQYLLKSGYSQQNNGPNTNLDFIFAFAWRILEWCVWVLVLIPESLGVVLLFYYRPMSAAQREQIKMRASMMAQQRASNNEAIPVALDAKAYVPVQLDPPQ